MKNRGNIYDLGACSVHPSYRAKRKPRQSKKFPKGCPQCWKIWHGEAKFLEAVS